MAFDPLKDIDPNRFYLDVQNYNLVAVEAKRARGKQGGNVVWPLSALCKVVQFLETHNYQNFLSTSEVLPIERVIIDATKDSYPVLRRVFQRHFLSKVSGVEEVLRQVDEDEEGILIETLYAISKSIPLTPEWIIVGRELVIDMSEPDRNAIVERLLKIKDKIAPKYVLYSLMLLRKAPKEVWDSLEKYLVDSIPEELSDFSIDTVKNASKTYDLFLFVLPEKKMDRTSWQETVSVAIKRTNLYLKLYDLTGISLNEIYDMLKRIRSENTPEDLISSLEWLKGRLSRESFKQIIHGSKKADLADLKYLIPMLQKESAETILKVVTSYVIGDNFTNLPFISPLFEGRDLYTNIQIMKVPPRSIYVRDTLLSQVPKGYEFILLEIVRRIHLDEKAPLDISRWFSGMAPFHYTTIAEAENAVEAFRSQLDVLLYGLVDNDEIRSFIEQNIQSIVLQYFAIREHRTMIPSLLRSNYMQNNPNLDRLKLLEIGLSNEILRMSARDKRGLTIAEMLQVQQTVVYLTDNLHGLWDAFEPYDLNRISLCCETLVADASLLEVLNTVAPADMHSILSCLQFNREPAFLKAMLKVDVGKRDNMLKLLTAFGNTCDNWDRRISFLNAMFVLCDTYKDQGMTIAERHIYIVEWFTLETEREQDLFQKQITENYPLLQKWFYAGLEPETREKFAEDLVAPAYEKIHLLSRVEPLCISGEPYFNRLVLAALDSTTPVEEIEDCVLHISNYSSEISQVLLPSILNILLLLPVENLGSALSKIVDWLPHRPLKVSVENIDHYRDCVKVLGGNLERLQTKALVEAIYTGAHGLKEWFEDFPRMAQFPHIEVQDSMFDMPDRMAILAHLEPILAKEGSIGDQKAFFSNLRKMLKNSKPEERKDIVTVCVGAHSSLVEYKDLARNLFETYFPTLYAVCTDDRSKLELGNALFRMVLREGPFTSPILEIFKADPQWSTVELLMKISLFGPAVIEALFGILLKDIAPENYRNLVLTTFLIINNLQDKMEFISQISSVPATERQRVLFLLNHYGSFTVETLKLIVKTLPIYNRLSGENFFYSTSNVNQFVIINLLERGISEDKIQTLIQAKPQMRADTEWIYVALILSGVSEEDSHSAVGGLNLIFQKEDILGDYFQKEEKLANAYLLMHVFSHLLIPIDDRINNLFTLASQIPSLGLLLRKSVTKEAFLDAIFEQLILNAEMQVQFIEPLEYGVYPTPFIHLPSTVTFREELTEGSSEERLALLKLFTLRPWFYQLKSFESRLGLEPEDYFILLSKQAPIPPLDQLNISAVPTISPDNRPDLKHILDQIQPPPEGEVRINNQRIIDATLARRDEDWADFDTPFFEELEKYLEPVYVALAKDPDQENVRAVLNSFSESTRRCPADWKNEAEFQYSRLFEATPEDFIQSLAANVRRYLVGGVIQELAKELMFKKPEMSYVKALQWLSDNHRRNWVVAALASRSVPGSNTISKMTDPYLPKDLSNGPFNPSKKIVEDIFDKLYTLRALVNGMEEMMHEKKSLLLPYLEMNPLAATYDQETWQAEMAELLEQQEPVIVVSHTDLTPLFNAQSGSPITSVEEIAVQVPNNPLLTLQMGNIRQFLQDRKGIPELQEPLKQWMADPSNKIAQKAFQEAFTLYEWQLEPRRKRDALKRELIPCKFTDKDDAALDAYMAGERSYKDIVELGIKNAQKDAFARSMIDPVTNKFKKEAIFLMLLQAGIYQSRTD